MGNGSWFMVNDANHETVIKKVSVHNSEQIQSNKFAEIFKICFESVVSVYLRLFLAYIPIIRIRRNRGSGHPYSGSCSLEHFSNPRTTIPPFNS
jgi:hypothetical protein